MAAIPEGFSTVTPSVVVQDAASAIDLYKKAFGAEELYRMQCPETNKVMHACLVIGNSKVFFADANPEMGCAATTSSFYVYLDNVDSAFTKAKQAGLSEKMPVQDMFWGDRTGSLSDKFGNNWTLATHTREVSKEDMEKGRDQFIAQMKAAKSKAA